MPRLFRRICRVLLFFSLIFWSTGCVQYIRTMSMEQVIKPVFLQNSYTLLLQENNLTLAFSTLNSQTHLLENIRRQKKNFPLLQLRLCQSYAGLAIFFDLQIQKQQLYVDHLEQQFLTIKALSERSSDKELRNALRKLTFLQRQRLRAKDKALKRKKNARKQIAIRGRNVCLELVEDLMVQGLKPSFVSYAKPWYWSYRKKEDRPKGKKSSKKNTAGCFSTTAPLTVNGASFGGCAGSSRF